MKHLILALVFFSNICYSADIIKCTSAEGQIVFSDKPCLSTFKADKITVKDTSSGFIAGPVYIDKTPEPPKAIEPKYKETKTREGYDANGRYLLGEYTPEEMEAMKAQGVYLKPSGFHQYDSIDRKVTYRK